MTENNPIGFFDSGIGGSTVLLKAIEIMPNENYVFFSDSAYNPYGDKSDKEIISRCEKIIGYLTEKEHCKAIVIACNTASAKAAQILRKRFDIPIIATEPAYKMAHDFNPDGFTLILATKGTIESEKFQRLYCKYNNHNTELTECVGLADLIEQNKASDINVYLEKKLGKYNGKVQNIVLGCTHYPLIKKDIEKAVGKVTFFDGSQGVSRQLRRVLENSNLLNTGTQTGKIKFIDTYENPSGVIPYLMQKTGRHNNIAALFFML